MATLDFDQNNPIDCDLNNPADCEMMKMEKDKKNVLEKMSFTMHIHLSLLTIVTAIPGTSPPTPPMPTEKPSLALAMSSSMIHRLHVFQ
uniref:Uncharacterized protein n=1 Tax=Oryza glumipatula TaxID=40148 RepID=A0A0E0B0X9_9ORYZ